MGGVNSTASYAIESAVGRIAQIIVKGNVGDAGYFANILKLNNIDTNIYPDRNFDCGTKNLVKITFHNEEITLLYASACASSRMARRAVHAIHHDTAA